MHDLIRSHFTTLQTALKSTNVGGHPKRIISDAIEKLPPLYQMYRDTNLSRYGDEITRLVQSCLRELHSDAESKSLEEGFREGMHRLHDDLGIPKLPLKPPPTVKSRKAK